MYGKTIWHSEIKTPCKRMCSASWCTPFASSYILNVHFLNQCPTQNRRHLITSSNHHLLPEHTNCPPMKQCIYIYE
jgi:hypothetical protein